MTSANAISGLVRERTEAIDERGRRTIRHRGPGANLVSLADQGGRLLRQELVLGTEVIVWQHGTRIRTGLVPAGTDDGSFAQFDRQPSRSRLDRARHAVEEYAGDDKYLQHLARIIALSSGLSLGSAEVVTRTDQERRTARKKPRPSERPYASYALIAAVAVAVFVLVYLAAR